MFSATNVRCPRRIECIFSATDVRFPRPMYVLRKECASSLTSVCFPCRVYVFPDDCTFSAKSVCFRRQVYVFFEERTFPHGGYVSVACCADHDVPARSAATHIVSVIFVLVFVLTSGGEFQPRYFALSDKFPPCGYIFLFSLWCSWDGVGGGGGE